LMSSCKLPNYLRSYRKRCGFTQDEIAWLLGCRYDTKVSRYERFARQPLLPTVFAYEVIFQTPARMLFPGVAEEVERAVITRAAELLERLAAKHPHGAIAKKLAALRAICAEYATDPES
jgi:transcriptional regulator with XRE-family HTH domain